MGITTKETIAITWTCDICGRAETLKAPSWPRAREVRPAWLHNGFALRRCNQAIYGHYHTPDPINRDMESTGWRDDAKVCDGCADDIARHVKALKEEKQEAAE